MSSQRNKKALSSSRKTKSSHSKTPKKLSIEKGFSPGWFKNDSRKPALFLGNGFNIAIDVCTSYECLFTQLNQNSTVQSALRSHLGENYARDIKKAGYNLEKILMGLRVSNKEKTNKKARQEKMQGKKRKAKEMPCRGFVLKEFYRIILDTCRKSKITPEAVKFFHYFGNFFTTNFDPLLYRFLETHKKTKKQADVEIVVKEMNKIREVGKIPRIPGYEATPLYELNETTQREIACQLKRMKNTPKFKRTVLDRCLEKHEAGKDLDYEDGFGETKKNVSYWQGADANQNLFYLHGGLHMFVGKRLAQESDSKMSVNDTVEEEVICQYAMSSPKKFIANMFMKFEGDLCVFEKNKRDKKKKVKSNDYLKHCLAALNSTEGSLCIIGWKCDRSDWHLFEDHKFNKIYVGIHRLDEKKEEFDLGRNNELANYCKLFGTEKVTFFNVEPLANKMKKKNKRKSSRKSEKSRTSK